VVPDFGLDGVFLRPSGEILFSIECGFWDEVLATEVGHGDLLSEDGVVVQTNPELLRNFHPMPSPGADYGLDAIDERSGTERWFSIEESFYDEVKMTSVGHGDLLSENGTIVKTNSELLANFFPMPAPDPDYGLDAAYVFDSGEMWFSTEDTFWDEVRGDWIRHGDLLSAGRNGTVVKTNAELLAAFFGGAGKVPGDLGLDAVCMVAPTIPEIPADANSDGVVDDKDASIVGAHWLQEVSGGWADGDFNADGLVNDADAAILAAHWGEGGGEESVPEPGSLALLAGMAAMGMVYLRRRKA
jgi:hypothetical protein